MSFRTSPSAGSAQPVTRFTMSQVFTLDVGLGTLVVLRSLGWGVEGFGRLGDGGLLAYPRGLHFSVRPPSLGALAHGQQREKKMAQ